MLWNDLITWRKAYSSLICSLGDRRQNGISRCLVMTQGLPGGVVVKNLPANAGDARDMGLIHGLGSSPGVGNGNSLQCSCLENSMDRGAWQATVHGVTKSWIWLSTYAHSCDDPVRDTTVGSVLVVVWGGLGRSSSSSNTGVGCHFLHQGILATQGLNPHLLQLLYCRWILYHWATGEAHSQCICVTNHHDMHCLKILFISYTLVKLKKKKKKSLIKQ